MSVSRTAGVAGCLLALGAGLVLAHLTLGRSDLPPGEVFRVLIGRASAPAYDIIVLEYRLPRVLIGLGVGALLAVSGVLVQAVVRNPLAEPSTTGVGAGAAFAVVVSLSVWPGHDLAHGSALVGALTVGGLLYVVGRRSFAVTGVLLGAVLAAGTSLVLVIDSASLGTVLRWLIGSLNARTAQDWAMLWPWLLVVVPIACVLASLLNAWALGETVAAGLGVRSGPLIAIVLLTAVAGAGAAIAAGGAIAFVGLVAPHIGRLLVGSDHRLLIPLSACLGALMLSLSDLVAFSISVQVPGLATDVAGVPVGAVTALIGAPVLVSLIRKENRT